MVRIVPPGRRQARGCGPRARSSDGARKPLEPVRVHDNRAHCSLMAEIEMIDAIELAIQKIA
ncbi:hypothetical protein [Burkholderia sp. USMB20]|uniref:hypothetical protein n=1 Tax=Burkholderia sp. USMB20 TaxID=1571773 RepID=UPI001091C16C|nr:hypothetical protein [Burkholderia sp. USMB20]TGN98266.1 hypothetical protein PL79_004240 [Burkholderia sp. USMB20]